MCRPAIENSLEKSNTADDNESDDENKPDVNDKTFEVCAINSNRNKLKLFINSDFNVPIAIF